MSDSDAGQDQFSLIVADYLQAVGSGQAPDREQLLQQYPELANKLRAFFADHDQMREVADPHVTWRIRT